MRIQLHNVIPALRPYVKAICSLDSDEDTDTNHIRVLPDTCVELFVNYTSTPVAIIEGALHQGSIITARMSRPTNVQMRKGAGCLAVCFHPGMAYRIFQVPMHALSDTTTALADLWNGLAADMEDKLACAADNETRVQIVQGYLLQQLSLTKDDVRVAWCLQQAHLSGGLIAVSKLATDAGISQRHLARQFQQHVGLSPKEYLGVYRFLRSLHYLKKYPLRSLTAIAYQSGYYDQAHFIRDCKTYSGFSPGELMNAQDLFY